MLVSYLGLCIFQLFYSSSSFVRWIGASIVEHATPVPDSHFLSKASFSRHTSTLATPSLNQVRIHLFNLNLPKNTRGIPNHDIYVTDH